ncbi:MAG: phosphotransferase, partial [Humidesulfovibrio sp.]|nr:phosphotransferase [Humidesulfovibrio sp.]
GMTGAVELAAVPGGRNNRAFVLSAGRDKAFLKAYFRHPDDPRDRLRSETALLAHAESLGIATVTRVLAKDVGAGLALFAFVEGRRLAPDEVGAEHVAAAANLYLALNSRPADLPNASEACFSLAQHTECVERRVGRLARAAEQGLMRTDAASFVTSGLVPAWNSLKADILAHVSGLPGGMEAALPRELRRVSPSDFGFHNALLMPEGGLVFLDFEYAGMDDPAKLVCDFFCQPEIPVGREHLPWFLERIAEASPGDADLRARALLLLPAYGIKWCCIMLNDFLPLGASRRDFAEGGAAEGRRDRQLALAKRSLVLYTK